MTTDKEVMFINLSYYPDYVALYLIICNWKEGGIGIDISIQPTFLIFAYFHQQSGGNSCPSVSLGTTGWGKVPCLCLLGKLVCCHGNGLITENLPYHLWRPVKQQTPGTDNLLT